MRSTRRMYAATATVKPIPDPRSRAFVDAMAQAGILRGTERLKPTSTATSIRVVDGKTVVLDGPSRVQGATR